MKSFIVFALFVAAAVAAPLSSDADAQIIRQNLDNIGVGSFSSDYETSNGISAQQEGALTNVGTENEALEVRGQFSYTAPDGVLYAVTYTAGANGYQPQGAHIPQA